MPAFWNQYVTCKTTAPASGVAYNIRMPSLSFTQTWILLWDCLHLQLKGVTTKDPCLRWYIWTKTWGGLTVLPWTGCVKGATIFPYSLRWNPVVKSCWHTKAWINYCQERASGLWNSRFYETLHLCAPHTIVRKIGFDVVKVQLF